MKALFISELERLWSKKSTWLIFCAIPIVLYASAKYYLKHNLTVTISSPEFTSFGNFPTAAIQEQLILFFDLTAILLIVLSVTDEYRSGQIRMAMVRTESFTKLFFAKFTAVIITLFLLAAAYFIFSIPIGYVLMDKVNNVHIFYYEGLSSIKDSFLYGIKYYFVAFLTLTAMTSVIMFISMISRTITTGIGSSLAVLFASMVYPQILLILFHKVSTGVLKLQLLSVTHIQHMGIAIMLGEKHLFKGYIFEVLMFYIITFTGLAYLYFKKSDKYI